MKSAAGSVAFDEELKAATLDSAPSTAGAAAGPHKRVRHSGAASFPRAVI
jgi:hypothetical protein